MLYRRLFYVNVETLNVLNNKASSAILSLHQAD